MHLKHADLIFKQKQSCLLMHQSDNMHDIQWRLRFKCLCANKRTSTSAFQVRSFIRLVLVNVDTSADVKMCLSHSRTIYNLKQHHPALLCSWSDLIWQFCMQLCYKLQAPILSLHGKKRFNVQKANAMLNSNRDSAKSARVVFIQDYYALLHLYNRHNLSLTDSKYIK